MARTTKPFATSLASLPARLLFALAACVLALPADAGGAPPEGWAPLDDGRLSTLRGGWSLPTGLVVSFGFERQAWVNGELVSSLRIDIPDLGSMTEAQARELARLRQVELVQVGPGHSAFASGTGPEAGLVLQNSLDGAHLRVLTTIDAGTSGLGVLQSLNFGEALGRAGAGAVGSP